METHLNCQMRFLFFSTPSDWGEKIYLALFNVPFLTALVAHDMILIEKRGPNSDGQADQHLTGVNGLPRRAATQRLPVSGVGLLWFSINNRLYEFSHGFPQRTRDFLL